MATDTPDLPETPTDTTAAPLAGPTPKDSSPQPEPKKAHEDPDFLRRVQELVKGTATAVAGTEELVDDLKDCARKQDEARKALEQASQFAQAKQGELIGLDGQANALVKILHRMEAAQKT